MKNIVLEKTRYILANSWFGLLLPAGVHHLLNAPVKAPVSPSYKQAMPFRTHPAEFRNLRSFHATIKP